MGRVVGPGEPLWLPEDRAWALALLAVEADACPECGQPWDESADPAAADDAGYVAELHRCHACATAARKVAAHQQDPRAETAGLHVLIRKR
jgi:hypothetical protein